MKSTASLTETYRRFRRDLKPSNLFIVGSGQVKLMDFGIALRTGETGATPAGTPCYMSPEQVRGEVLHPSSDIFSLGMVLFGMMSGRIAPAPGEAERPCANLPKQVQSVIVRCLQQDPADRFPSATELKAALATAKGSAQSKRPRMRYKKTQKRSREIGRDLDVDGIIEGTVLRSGARVRITLQLIDTATERHLWAASFERDPKDVLALQADVARSIAAELKVTLSPAQGAGYSRGRKATLETYDAYLRGWYFFNRGNYPDAASYFDRATRADPTFALAYALLAEADGMNAYVQEAPLSARGHAAAAFHR